MLKKTFLFHRNSSSYSRIFSFFFFLGAGFSRYNFFSLDRGSIKDFRPPNISVVFPFFKPLNYSFRKPHFSMKSFMAFSSLVFWSLPFLFLGFFLHPLHLPFFLPFWALIPHALIFTELKIPLSWEAHFRLLILEIWSFSLLILGFLGLFNSYPLGELSLGSWFRHLLWIPFSLFMIYRSWKPKQSWFSMKMKEVQNYLHQDVLLLMGLSLEYRGASWVRKYLIWLSQVRPRDVQIIYFYISWGLVFIPLTLLLGAQFWSWILVQDLGWSWMSMPLLIVLRFHQILLDFIPGFLEGTERGIKEMEESFPEKNFQSSKIQLEHSRILYRDYLDYSESVYEWFYPLRWFLIFFFSVFLVLNIF